MNSAPQSAFPSDLFAGQTVLVAGGTRGIGIAVAAQLAEGGATVIINGRSQERGETALALLRKRIPNGRFDFAQGNAIDAESCNEMFARIDERHPRLTGVVNSTNTPVAGASGLFSEVDPSTYRDTLDTALLSLMNLAHATIPRLKAAGGGAFVIFATDAGKIAGARQTMIGSTRAGIMMFVRSLALEVARDGITVNCVSPSFVKGTEIYEAVRATHGAERVARAEARAGLGLPDAEDVARLAVFLASPWAVHLTGQVVSINGGVSAG